MIVKFNALNRYETPTLTLCNPGCIYENGVLSNAVAILPDVSDMEFVYNFNSTSELNFRITKNNYGDEILSSTSVDVSGSTISHNVAGSATCSRFELNIPVTQDGSGSPSISNIRPIRSYSSATLSVNGSDSLIDWSSYVGSINGGTVNVLTGQMSVEYVSVVLDPSLCTITRTATNTFRLAYNESSMPNAAHADARNGVAGAVFCSHFETKSYADVYVYGESGIAIGPSRRIVLVSDAFNDSVSVLTEYLNGQINNGTPVVCCFKITTPISGSIRPLKISLVTGANTISTSVGIISATFNELYTMSSYIKEMFRAVQNRRLLYAENIGFFMITNVQQGYDEDRVEYKDVTASSIEVEIQNRKIPYIADGTYRFYTDVDSTQIGLLQTVVATLPLWTIGHVDDTIQEKYRTFEDVSVDLNCLGFMLENMQDAYECIFVFDTVNRIINVYDQNNYVVQTDIHITRDDLINNIEINESSEEVYTALSVFGDEELSISAVNPLGTSVIYNFSNYISWMTPALAAKVTQWQIDMETAESDYYTENLAYYDLLTQLSNYTAEYNRITTQLTMYTRCRNNIVAEAGTDLVDDYNLVIAANGGTEIVIYEEISQTLAEIDGLIADAYAARDTVQRRIDNTQTAIESKQADIAAIRESVNLSTYFSANEYAELANYIFEGSYSDEYVTVTDIMSYDEKFQQMKILYDRAKVQLEKISKPTQEFEIGVENFVFVKDFSDWTDQLETGCLINAEIEEGDIAALFLSTITINYEDHDLSMKFGNRFNKFDTKSLFEDMLGNISRTANTVDYVKDILYPIKNGDLNKMEEALQSSRDLTMDNALSATDEDVVIDGSGYTGRKKLPDGTYDPRQVKLVGKSLVFTDDAWQTAKVAVGELILDNEETAYGINAETLIGDIIMGNNLHIYDNNGNELLTAVDDKIATYVDGEIDEVNQSITQLQQDAQAVSIRVTTLENTEIDHVTTSTGYTFNADGLTISKSGQEMKNLLDNTGMYVTRSGDPILTANNEGVEAINLTARQYLTIGVNSRFEDYSNGTDTKRTACFYIGE